MSLLRVMSLETETVAAQLGAEGYLVADTARSALFLLLQSLFKTTNRREVIVPCFCCESVVLSVLLSGGVPKLIDVSVENFSISLHLTEKAINSNTASIILPHMFGISAYSEHLFDLYSRHQNIIWIDDACQTYLNFDDCGRRLGSQLDFGLLSFDPSKPLDGQMGFLKLNSRKSYANGVMENAKKNCDNSGDKAQHYELKRLQSFYFGSLVSIHRETSQKIAANSNILRELKPLFSMHISPDEDQLDYAAKSLVEASSMNHPSGFFRKFLTQLGDDTQNFLSYNPKTSDKIWRLPILLNDQRNQRQLSYELRSRGIQVSNHYFALSYLFPQYANNCEIAEGVSSRILNLWFRSEDEAVRAADTISKFYK